MVIEIGNGGDTHGPLARDCASYHQPREDPGGFGGNRSDHGHGCDCCRDYLSEVGMMVCMSSSCTRCGVDTGVDALNFEQQHPALKQISGGRRQDGTQYENSSALR